METTGETNRYRAVLDGLARSRGLSGPEELAERASRLYRQRTGRRYTRRELLTAGRGGFGDALDVVLEMDEAERKALVRAVIETFWPPNRG